MSNLQREGVQSWVETTTARERVRAIARTLGEPRSTNWISREASTAWSTADQELQALVEQGWLRCVETDSATLYQPDHTQLLFEELRRLVEENTREELQLELVDIAEEIEQWQAEYAVETKQELERTLAENDYSSAELRERRDVLQYWRENEQDRRLINHALELYSDIEAAREETTDALERATS